MVIFAIVCCHGNVIYSYERKWNPRCVPNLHSEYQELKPKVETNTSFLVRHPFSDVDTVKTIGSHLNCQQILAKISFVIFDIVVKKQMECGLAWHC